MVISEKLKVTRMNGETVGFGGEYDIKDVPHAMRLSNSGTFVHGNYWARRRPSATTTPATAASACGTCAARGDREHPGRLVLRPARSSATWSIVKNSNDKTIAPDNGLNGWNMSWAEWTK